MSSEPTTTRTQKNPDWAALLSKWMRGVVHATIKTTGPKQIKVVTRGMSMVFCSLLAKEAAAKGGRVPQNAQDPEEVFRYYRGLEVSAGLTEESQVECRTDPTGNTSFVFHRCCYGPMCNDLLSELMARGDINKSSAPCLRLETYTAAASLLAKLRRPYRLVQFAPGAKCEGELIAKPTTHGEAK